MTDLNRFLEAMKKTNLIPFIIGRHGIGKTQRVASYAKDFGYELIVIEGTVLKEGEITGLPLNINSKVDKNILGTVDLVTKVNKSFGGDSSSEEIEIDSALLMSEAIVQLNQTLVQEDDEEGVVLTYSKYLQFRKAEELLKEGKKVVIFIDESNRVPSEVLTEFMNFCQTKKINTVDFSKYGKNVYIILAGNPANDKDYNYQTTEFNEAFKDRLAPIELTPDFAGWHEWAIGKVDSRILLFLNNNKNLLHSWKSGEELRGATNRSWEELSKLITDVTNEELQAMYAPMVNATIGISVGALFIASLTDMKPLFPEKFIEGKPFDKEKESSIRQVLSARDALNQIGLYMEKNPTDKEASDKMLTNFAEICKTCCLPEAVNAVLDGLLNSSDIKVKKLATLLLCRPEMAKLKEALMELNRLRAKIN